MPRKKQARARTVQAKTVLETEEEKAAHNERVDRGIADFVRQVDGRLAAKYRELELKRDKMLNTLRVTIHRIPAEVREMKWTEFIAGGHHKTTKEAPVADPDDTLTRPIEPPTTVKAKRGGKRGGGRGRGAAAAATARKRQMEKRDASVTCSIDGGSGADQNISYMSIPTTQKMARMARLDELLFSAKGSPLMVNGRDVLTPKANAATSSRIAMASTAKVVIKTRDGGDLTITDNSPFDDTKMPEMDKEAFVNFNKMREKLNLIAKQQAQGISDSDDNGST